jgi:hypothetical protein
MRVGLVDCGDVAAGRGRAPGFVSPALLQIGAAHIAAGDGVTLLEGPTPASQLDKVLMSVPPWCGRAADEVTMALAGAPIERVDPWSAPASSQLPDYTLARTDRHGEVDLPPGRVPVHPWVMPSAGGLGAERAHERLRAAVAGLSGMRQTALVAGDERLRVDMDRLRLLADLVAESLRERKSLINLHLRAWPADLGEERILDHLSLLPLKSLDLLVGSVNEPSLRQMRSPLGASDLVAVVAAVARAGLAQLTTLSVALGLPGESIDAAVAGLNSTLQLAGQHGIPAVRVSLWLGGGPPPGDPDDQRRRFLDSHPDWNLEQYLGLHDVIAVLREVAPHIELIGPGFVPSWPDPPVASDPEDAR